MLLYSSDSPPTASPSSNLISIQLDSITLNKIIADAEAQAKIVKELNFRDVNGFTKLIEGESSKFSFFNNFDESSCDVNCDVRCQQPPRNVVSSPRPFLAKKDSVTGPPYLPPVTKKDEAVTFKPTTAARVSTTARQTTTSPIVARTTTTAKTVISNQPTRTFSSSQRQTTTRSTTTVQSSTQRPIAQTTTQKPISEITASRITTTIAQRTTRPIVSVTKPRSSTPGPTYLPVSKKSTVSRSTVTERSYPPATWPSTTRIYTQTFPTWSAPIRRSTTTRTAASSTVKYLYKAPSNALIYAGEAD